MPKSRWTGFKVFTLLFIFIVAAVFLWKSMPPYYAGVHTVAEASSAPAGGAPRIGNCPVFPADNVWNMPIDKLPRDRRSDAYIGSIGPNARLHPDFASNPAYGLPFTEIPDGTRSVGTDFYYAADSDNGNYPIPPDAPIEGGPNAATDRHVILIDQRRCLLYELFDMHPNPDGTWSGGSGIRWDLTDNALRPAGLGTADAAGLPIFPGLVRYDEIVAGSINHALRFTIPHTQGAFIWPARHKASPITDLNVPPMGTRLRLRANFDISGYSKENQVIMIALKKYGMFLSDNGGPLFVTGVPDKRWDDADLHKLNGIAATDFEAVDESEWEMLINSARVDPVAFAAR